MTPAEIGLYCSLALSIIALIGHAKNWINSGEKELNASVASLETRVQETEKKVSGHDRRIQSIEGDMKHLPDRDSQHRLELSMVEMNGRMSTVVEALKPIQATSERMNELLMNGISKS